MIRQSTPVISRLSTAVSERARILSPEVHRKDVSCASKYRTRFACGTCLLYAGTPGNTAWLITQGVVEIVLKTGDTSERLWYIGPGGIVGEMGLIDDGVRSATARARGNVEAIAIDRERVQSLLDESPPIIRILLRHLIASLRNLYALDPDKHAEKPVLSIDMAKRAMSERQTFRAQDVFFHEGESGDTLYFLRSGAVCVFRENRWDGSIEHVATLGPGRIFGELAVLTNKTRTASVRAETDGECDVISTKELSEAIEHTPKLLRTLLSTYARRIW